MKAMRRCFKSTCTPHNSSSEIRAVLCSQVTLSRVCADHCSPTYRSYSDRMSGATHVGACTPFVTCVIGTSSMVFLGQSFCQRARDTAPCLRLTPLVDRHMRIASGVKP